MTRQGFSLESIIIHSVDMAARLIAVSMFFASAGVWIAILATR